MILIALSLLLVIIFFYDIKLFVPSLLVYFVFFDMFDGFYEENKIYSAIRYLIPLALIAFYMMRFDVLKKSDFIFLILTVYLVFLWIVNSGDILVSSRNLMALFITLLLIPVGKHLGRSVDFVQEFEKYNRVLLIALPLYIISANVFNFGESYTDEFSTGFLITSRMYVVPIVVFLAIHYIITNKERSWLIKATDASFILLNLCLLLINTRRTTLGMLLGALFVYTLLNRKIIFQMVMLVFVLVATLVFTYPLYEAKLTAQLEKRERIQNLDTYEEEGRVLETLYIMDYHQKRENLAELLCGVKLFDTYEFGAKYFGRGRPIHSDINMIFFSTGIIGVILFSMFFLHYFYSGNRRILHHNRKLYYPLLIVFLMVLLPGRFIGTLTYAPLLMLLLSSIKYCRLQPEAAKTGKEEAEGHYYQSGTLENTPGTKAVYS
ncbi:hypothetical protein [Botryobacter ruber]|uniref:hypothetical protein n=1 Tax=Botryobacter ruber TaxID=2171629 RepID=UPI000E0BF38A|nr:hypothetical protein [Botryobacter ruber]